MRERIGIQTKKHILAAAIMATSSLIMADDSREKFLGELEAASVALRLDVGIHINSIQDKYKRFQKDVTG